MIEIESEIKPRTSVAMKREHKVELWLASLFVLILVGGSLLFVRWRIRRPISLQGSVMMQDADPRKQRPIADVQVSAEDDLATGTAKTDSTGFFQVTLPKGIRRGHPILFHFRHPRYLPLDVGDFVGDKLYVVRMAPLPEKAALPSGKPDVKISNVRLRYSIKSRTDVNVGSAVQTFEVQNKGNIPCKGQHPCSPDGKWKAALGSTTLDAGPGNEFRNARVSCIAGPCPFTRIESDHFSTGGQVIMVTARDWSDTAMFLVEAEVFHPMASQVVHQSYPVIFGQALNFTLPPAAEGVNMQADMDGQTIIFPLGPSLFLSWASCNGRVNADQTRVYRCELKPGYRFP
jgi:hypothetical protein